MKRVIEFIKENVENSSTVIVACSGGPDSMCLLNLLNELKDDLELKIVVAHVNHKVRMESEKEAEEVKKYAIEHGNIFEYIEFKEYEKGNFDESDARWKRYNFFSVLMNKYKAKYLFTAHHGDDLMETVLMRITRGSNLNGYSGIKLISKNSDYEILRPLLYVSKEDIIKYLENKRISYAIDKTNEEDIHTRNRYRHNILPFLKKENKNVHEKYLKFANELNAYEEFVSEYIEKKQFIVDNKIVINKLEDESALIKRKCIEKLVREIQKEDYFDISDEQMDNLMSLYKQNNKMIDLNNHYRGINSYGYLLILKNNDRILSEAIIDADMEIGNFIFIYNSKDKDNSNSCICLSSEEVCLPLKLRGYKDGDRMMVKNLNGTKKVSDIFIDAKVPRHERSTYPILVDAKDRVLWVPNLKKSKFSHDISEKCDIIIKCKAKENVK